MSNSALAENAPREATGGAPLCRWIRANGLEFAYLEAGEPPAPEAPLVLCLHGFPDSAWSFVPLISTLRDAGFRAIALFMRGYAPGSIPADGDYRITSLARDAVALIDHFGAERAMLVGHDWGAAATYAAATLRPDRIHRIVTAAVPHLRRFLLRPTRRQLVRSRYMAQFQIRGYAERLLAARDGAWVRALAQRWSPGWTPTEAWFQPVQAMLQDPERRRAMLGYYRALPGSLLEADTWQLIGRPVPVPARLIAGADDGCIGAEMFEDQDHLFAAGHEVIVMPGCGHFMQLEQPDVFARHVLEFLRPA